MNKVIISLVILFILFQKATFAITQPTEWLYPIDYEGFGGWTDYENLAADDGQNATVSLGNSQEIRLIYDWDSVLNPLNEISSVELEIKASIPSGGNRSLIYATGQHNGNDAMLFPFPPASTSDCDSNQLNQDSFAFDSNDGSCINYASPDNWNDGIGKTINTSMTVYQLWQNGTFEGVRHSIDVNKDPTKANNWTDPTKNAAIMISAQGDGSNIRTLSIDYVRIRFHIGTPITSAVGSFEDGRVYLSLEGDTTIANTSTSCIINIDRADYVNNNYIPASSLTKILLHPYNEQVTSTSPPTERPTDGSFYGYDWFVDADEEDTTWKAEIDMNYIQGAETEILLSTYCYDNITQQEISVPSATSGIYKIPPSIQEDGYEVSCSTTDLICRLKENVLSGIWEMIRPSYDTEGYARINSLLRDKAPTAYVFALTDLEFEAAEEAAPVLSMDLDGIGLEDIEVDFADLNFIDTGMNALRLGFKTIIWGVFIFYLLKLHNRALQV